MFELKRNYKLKIDNVDESLTLSKTISVDQKISRDNLVECTIAMGIFIYRVPEVVGDD
jgi:hypothetical protein